MSDIVKDPDTVAEQTDGAVVEEQTLGSVNDENPNSPKRTKKKTKKSKCDKRRNRSSSKSHKSKSAPKIEDLRNSKDDSDARERRPSSEKFDQDCFSHKNVKAELLSDDQGSSVSEKRRLLITRSRIRRIQRRKAYSSTSSVPESDYRKTKSEPIIITLDSDSEGAMSLVSNRPNRSARIRGEIIRKLSGTTTKMSTYKSCDSSSSSSDFENVKRKKKSKSKSVKSSSSQAAKRKKYLVKHLASKSRLKLTRKHRKHVATVYTAARPKRNISSIRKRFKAQKRVKIHEKNFSSVTTRKRSENHQNTKITGRRTLRSTSTDVTGYNRSKQEDAEAVQTKKNDSESKSQPAIAKSSDARKLSDDLNFKKQAKKESVSTSPEEGERISKNLDAAKAEMVVNETEENMEATSHVSANEQESSEKAESMSNVGLNEEIQPNTTAKQELDSSKEVKAQTDNKFPQKIKKLKKKLKPGDTMIVRKRGRPRLSEMKPVKNIPVLNDMVQIPFLQSSFCFNVAPKLPKCRECRIVVARANRSMFHAYCRFMEYRKLCYHKNGTVLNAGFSEPSEATAEHLNQWLPQLDDPPKDLNTGTSKALIEHIGDQFCDLIEQEKEALSLHVGKDKVVTWKRIVQGVREMCDVCYTTLFNIHWVCPICGLAVCIDCYKGRLQGITVEYEDGQPKNRDQYNWLLCTTMKQPHDPEKLLMAQIIPGNALWTMRDLLHKVRKMWDIPSYCKCNPHAIASSDKYISTGICKQLMCSLTKSFSCERSSFFYTNGSNNAHNNESNYDDLDFEVSGSALKWLEGDLDGLKSSEDYYTYEDYASLRGNLLNCTSGDDSFSESEREITSFSLDDIIACVTKPQNSDNKENSGKSVVKHFSHRYPQPISGRDPLPIRIYTKLESDLAFSNVPHSWFCNGRLLFLLQSDHPDNLALFQEMWKRGQPILVKGVDERLSIELWHPDAFCRDFGEVKNDLVDCRTGAIIKNLPMRKFWEGFESLDKRLKDDDGECRLLKLKDWPPGEDFSEKLPRRFHDLMKGLPLPEYTHRDGVLNLAGRLPPWFVRPDLGPKMYNAYGSALYPTKGTTNLHLDISDAVNVMVYVGIPQDGNAQLHIEEALKAIDDGGCDSLMRARVRCRGAKPGALWHIYNARDADKIRELLTKVAVERGEKLEAHHDPIHDQSWYLDAELRKRLYRDYGVEGYAIAQCLGDAVFIPAGAPHQVRNLHSCVKVAEDFVSPENIAHCFKLTQEFRHLTDSHTNHEDKLQIKNIIYHVVRDALAYLLADVECLEGLES